MNHRLKLLTLLVTSVALWPMQTAFAEKLAEKPVSVRSTVNDDYTRLVFDFDSAPSYLADQSKTGLTLNFQTEHNLSAASSLSGTERVKGVSVPNNKNITLDFNSPKEIRYFTIGNRVIVDVYGEKKTEDGGQKAESPKTESVKVETPKAESPKTEPSAKEEIKTDKKLDTKPDVKEDKLQEEPTSDVKSDIKKDIPKEDVKPDQDITSGASINLTATESLNLAVFRRGETLFIVSNQVVGASSPLFEGDKSLIDQLKKVETIPLSNGTLYQVSLPKEYAVRAEGGGKSWKILLSKNDANQTAPIAIQKQTTGLVWNVANASNIVNVTDPITGQALDIIPVTNADMSAPSQEFVEFTSLESDAGLVLLPKIDNLSVKISTTKIDIGSQNVSANFTAPKPSPETKLDTGSDTAKGEVIAEESATKSEIKQEVLKDTTRYFDFTKWQLGNKKSLSDNRKTLLKDFDQKNTAVQADMLIALAKMELAHNHAAEAKGYLEFATSLVPELETAPTIKALHAAIESLLNHHEDAFQLLADEALKDNAEIQLWRAYSLANLEDWAQAGENFPDYSPIIETYPPQIQIPFGLSLAEVALRNGDVRTADKILELLVKSEKEFRPADEAAMAYLRGESDRQKGKLADAKKFWEPLTSGHDDLYRVKAGLSLLNLELEKKEITVDEAIDRLEGFRYTWRGDELETSVNSRLGKLYIEKGDPMKGLSLLRQAATLNPESEGSKQITDLMQKTYSDLFLTDQINKLSPIDAVTIHQEFSELTPTDENGDAIIQKLVDRLVEVDLLPRAATLLQTQIDSRLTGVKGANAAVKLAQILTEDGAGDRALPALTKADEFLKDVAATEAAPIKRDIAIARARAYGAMNKPDEALSTLGLLNQDEEILRLRADIAWDTNRPQEAADALQELAASKDISPSRPADDEQAEILLNWALALHKADNKFVLSDLRERFQTTMAASPLKEKFEIVTRPQQNSLMVDKSSIEQMMAEIDLFKNADKISDELKVEDGGQKAEVKDSSANPIPNPIPDESNTELPAEGANKVTPQETVEKPKLDQPGEAEVAGAEGAAGNSGSSSPTP